MISSDPVTPGAVNRLRETVEDWLEKAAKAVWTFHIPETNTFRCNHDSSGDNVSYTSTSRCFMALAYAHKTVERRDSQDFYAKWSTSFDAYMKSVDIKIDFDSPTIGLKNPTKSHEPLSHFETAHLMDLVFVDRYLTRFTKGHSLSDCSTSLTAAYSAYFNKLSELDSEPRGSVDKLLGQWPFDKPSSGSVDVHCGNHYFVNLHSLRAASIAKIPAVDYAKPPESYEEVRRFCIEQCYYVQRGETHKVDAIRLAFAGTIYCLYAGNKPTDLAQAVIETLGHMQLPTGNWPASFPIFRTGHKNPWHIASHELALSLTWMYFLPSLPEAARQRLLQILEKYFRSWVMPTYSSQPGASCSGWFHDHQIRENAPVGWVTAIVCHFLANYHSVLSALVNHLTDKKSRTAGGVRCLIRGRYQSTCKTCA